jgi:signal transduction histidine kinase
VSKRLRLRDLSIDLRQLFLISIAAPVAFLAALEAFGVFVLRPTFGNNPALRLLIVFAILTVAVVPFSLWIFGVIRRQRQELVVYNRQLDAVNGAITSISRAIDLNQVLQNIADAARDLVPSRYAALGVADESGKIIDFITSGITQEQRSAIGTLPVGNGLLGVLIKEGKPLRIPDISKDPASAGFPPNHPPMKSLLGVPIVFKGVPVGDLYLTEKIGADEFSEEDQELVMLLASHAAVAIENARLYEDARRSRDRLQAWNDQLEAIVAERTREIERRSKEMTTRVLEAQEEERKRIARELHDETAQSLSALLITMDVIEPQVPRDNSALQAGLERLRELTRRTLDEIRALSHGLRPTMLDDVGLVAALQWYADEHCKTFGVPVDVKAEAVPAGPGHEGTGLPPQIEIALFRIAQEALTNSGKHAHADWCRVTLAFPDGVALLIIEDNGKGYDLDEAKKPSRSGGLGLYGMKERATLLDGTLAVETSAGKGTRIVARVPLPEVDATAPHATLEEDYATLGANTRTERK